MSIIIHFNTVSFIPPTTTLSSSPYVSRAKTTLAMVPGIDETDQTVMTDDDNSMVDIATSNTLYTHAINDLKIANHVLGSYFGLPYQDHNYGAPHPDLFPRASPAHANGVPDEDTNLSIGSTSTANEETQECSITRCICGFEHDDEYMICCDLCLVWQHVDCMGLDRNNIPETYLCEKCEPRKVDKHKAKVLQTRKKVAMTDSSDSEEDPDIKNVDRKQKNRKRRRKESEKNDEKLDQVSGKKSKPINKHTKERIEAKRSKLRRTKNKESTSTADEEAQDAWEISMEWCEKNFEAAVSNQYTPEVQDLAKTLPMLGHEERIIELLLTRNCRVIDGNQKRLISAYDIPRDQPLIEYKGKFLLASQFNDLHPAFSKRLFPYVMFYTLEEETICIDSSVYGNEARFVRRSCKPNAELHHLVYNGNLRLYISSTKAVFKDDEITLPLDFTSLKESIKDIECACETEDCILKFHSKNGTVDISHDKKRKGRKIFLSADDDSSHSFLGNSSSPTKCKSLIKNNSETTEGKYDHETEEQANERKKKTREERKIDAIMRAFDQMEKAAKRRQQALERQKSQPPKLEEISEKPESIGTSKEEDKVTTASGSETQCGEEDKTHISTTKPKKGKRRRGSGTPVRRRTRTNSGGSDILLLDENVVTKQTSLTISDAVPNSEPSVEVSSVTTSSANSVSAPVSVGIPTSPVVLKTKRFLLHEWLQEKSETNTNPSTTSPVSIRTEVKWNTTTTSPTCYVQCTKDNPHSGGISAAHLRRSSTSSQIKPFPLKSCSEPGFTKKRWLRQALFDCSSYDEPLTIDPGGMEGFQFENVYLSPNSHGDLGSPGAVDDTVTPLKKRRLMRESVDCVSSPLSPTMQSSVVIAVNSANKEIKTETEEDIIDQELLSTKDDSSELCPLSKEDVPCKINGLRSKHEILRKSNLKEELSNYKTYAGNLIMPNCQVSIENLNLSTTSIYKEVKVAEQDISGFEEKVCDSVINTSVQESVLDIAQTNCEVNNIDDSSINLHDNIKIQSNCETDKNSADKCEESIQFKSTNEDSIVKQKVIFSEDSSIQCDNFEHSSQSFKADFLETGNDTSGSHSDTSELITEIGIEKIPEDNVNNVNESNSIQSDVCKNVGHCSDSICNCAEQDASVSSTKNTDISSNVSLDGYDDSVDSDVTLPKNNMLTDTNTVDSELVCDHNVSDDANASDEKQSEFSHVDSKTSQFCCDDLNLRTTCVSATQKRKVSLSEYRLRMKDGSNKRVNSEDTKKSMTSPAIAIPETLTEQVTLAPLPLFDTAAESQSPPQATVKTPKKETVKREKDTYSDLTEHRENLTERLKREFGFDDEPQGSTPALSHAKSITGSTPAMPLCAQPLPPPPPPPPPRLIRSPQTNINVASATSSPQSGFNLPTPYATPSYIVPQVPRAQFIQVQQTTSTPVMPPIHPIPTLGVQCSIQPTLLPSSHSFAPSLSGTVLQPSIQHEFPSVNAQNYAALIQQSPPPPPPPPPPKSYPHVYQQNLYK